MYFDIYSMLLCFLSRCVYYPNHQEGPLLWFITIM